MTKHNALNDRIKRRYFVYLREAKGMSEASIDQVAKAISRFETFTNGRDFKAFHIEQAKAFKQRLSEHRGERTDQPLSKATVYSTLAALKTFFVWLAGQPGYRSRLSYADTEYFNLNLKDSRIAKASRMSRVPTLEQIHHVIRSMPARTEIEMRDRAVICFTILTGARDGATASLKLKHVDLDQRLVEQDARDVLTKFSKSFPTYFFPVGEEIEAIVIDWVKFLVAEKLFGFDDPLFPATRVSIGADGLFSSAGLDRKPWSNAGPIRTIFRKAFVRVGMPYFNPHAFRKTLAQLGQKLCGGNIAAMKAWSQNLGHEELMTTFTSYGALNRNQQAELMASIPRRGA